eukprot:scaffold191456_cov25-Tisochrysis_lutea.AAC.1
MGRQGAATVRQGCRHSHERRGDRAVMGNMGDNDARSGARSATHCTRKSKVAGSGVRKGGRAYTYMPVAQGGMTAEARQHGCGGCTIACGRHGDTW